MDAGDTILTGCESASRNNGVDPSWSTPEPSAVSPAPVAQEGTARRDELLVWLKEHGDRSIAKMSARQIVMLYGVVSEVDALATRLADAEQAIAGERVIAEHLRERARALDTENVALRARAEQAEREREAARSQFNRLVRVHNGGLAYREAIEGLPDGTLGRWDEAAALPHPSTGPAR